MEPLGLRDLLTIMVGWLIFGLVRMHHVLGGSAARSTSEPRTSSSGVPLTAATGLMSAPSTHRHRLIPHTSRGNALVK